ncbi:MAG: hypothetical protein VX427_10105 [Acidobacteriota bacterium]|nr:hypothetical protein [Acidobacteriota bacterium]
MAVSVPQSPLGSGRARAAYVPATTGPAFTAAEHGVLRRLRTPLAVQRYLNALPYNTAAAPLTLRSFRGVVRHQTAHCLEAVLLAATALEQHGYPPLVLSFESIDHLDHVLFVYQWRGHWGAVARSRDPGLHGRKAVFRTTRALALSYVEPYVDLTGRLTGYAVVDLRKLGRYDWRFSERNVWKAERILLDHPHRPIRTPDHRVTRWRNRHRAFLARFPGHKPRFFAGEDSWSELPAAFRRVIGRGNTRRCGGDLNEASTGVS